MSETASTIPPSGLGKLQLNDFWKSLLLAAISNVLLGLYTIIQSGHFPSSEDWGDMAKSTIAIILSYLIKNISTNNTGQILKKDQPIVAVSAEKLEEVVDKANENK